MLRERAAGRIRSAASKHVIPACYKIIKKGRIRINEMETQVVVDYCKARVVILGCGNILFGDDGFGPEAVEY